MQFNNYDHAYIWQQEQIPEHQVTMIEEGASISGLKQDEVCRLVRNSDSPIVRSRQRRHLLLLLYHVHQQRVQKTQRLFQNTLYSIVVRSVIWLRHRTAKIICITMHEE